MAKRTPEDKWNDFHNAVETWKALGNTVTRRRITTGNGWNQYVYSLCIGDHTVAYWIVDHERQRVVTYWERK